MNIYIYIPNKIGGVKEVMTSIHKNLILRGYKSYSINSISKLLYLSILDRKSHFMLSLQSGLLAPFIGSRGLYVVHGFPLLSTHNFSKFIILLMTVMWCNFCKTKTVAVSYLTKLYFNKIFSIEIKYEVLNGVSDQFFTLESQYRNKKKQVFYIGTINSAKKIQESLRAFLQSELYKTQGYIFLIAGDGPDLEALKKQFITFNAVIFLGLVTEGEKLKLFRESEIFISLHDLEPMGVVYAEAICCSCKLIAPIFAGCREYVPLNYPAIFCNPDSIESITCAFNAILNSEHKLNFDFSIFNYNRVVDQYLEILHKK